MSRNSAKVSFEGMAEVGLPETCRLALPPAAPDMLDSS